MNRFGTIKTNSVFTDFGDITLIFHFCVEGSVLFLNEEDL